jgi:hypothetical protein
MRLPVSGQKRHLRSADLVNHDRAGRRPQGVSPSNCSPLSGSERGRGAADRRDGRAAAQAATVMSRAGPVGA